MPSKATLKVGNGEDSIPLWAFTDRVLATEVILQAFQKPSEGHLNSLYRVSNMC